MDSTTLLFYVGVTLFWKSSKSSISKRLKLLFYYNPNYPVFCCIPFEGF